MPRVLIADDQPAVMEALRLLLKGEGCGIKAVASPADVIEALSRQSFDAALIDLNYTRDTTSGQEGLDLLARVREIDPTLPVVVMTAWGSVELAVEAMQRGARDFVQKPWDNARLLSILRTQTELARARHGHGGHGGPAPRPKPSRPEADGHGQRGRARRGNFRERVVRPR